MGRFLREGNEDDGAYHSIVFIVRALNRSNNLDMRISVWIYACVIRQRIIYYVIVLQYDRFLLIWHSFDFQVYMIRQANDLFVFQNFLKIWVTSYQANLINEKENEEYIK